VRQTGPGTLEIGGDRDSQRDERWTGEVLGAFRVAPPIGDPVVAEIATRFPGVRPYNNASLFESVVGCIAGQSITVQAAAVTERRICALAGSSISIAGRDFWPSPLPEQIVGLTAEQLRSTGVTWRRAEAILAAAHAKLAGELPTEDEARADPDAARIALRKLPLVGEWTSESVLLWGLGADDAFPPNDAALLRAARLAYGQPELNHRGLIALSDGWRPGRAWASRWLWIAMFGTPLVA
jgi:3-methyladenine DNA glycosylase/8-oxoguanine DNA glycosylase